MSTKYNPTITAPKAEDIISLAGQGNTLQQESSVQMADDAQVIGGDKVEFGGALIKAGGDYLGQNAVMLGDNSSYHQTALDPATENVITNALAAMGANANNFMSWIAGRDPEGELVDTSIEAIATEEPTIIPEVAASSSKWGWVVVVVVLAYVAFKKVRK